MGLEHRVKTSVDAETMAELERRAKQADRSVSAIVRLAIRAYLNGKEDKA